MKSHRHPSQPTDEEATTMDRESEQELLGVLPDLPFKDDELLGMFSSDLKQEQGVYSRFYFPKISTCSASKMADFCPLKHRLSLKDTGPAKFIIVMLF